MRYSKEDITVRYSPRNYHVVVSKVVTNMIKKLSKCLLTDLLMILCMCFDGLDIWYTISFLLVNIYYFGSIVKIILEEHIPDGVNENGELTWFKD